MQGAIRYSHGALAVANLAPAPPKTHTDDAEVDSGPRLRLGSGRGSVSDVVADNAVIVFGKPGCCMGHVICCLLLSIGANPAIYEVKDEEEADVCRNLDALAGGGGVGGDDHGIKLPVLIIGGQVFGGLDRVMGTHISGELVPVLKRAGALWL